MGAAGAVRGRDVVPLDGDLDVPLAVEEVVDRIVAVPAGDDHRGSAQLVEPLGQLAPRAAVPRQRLGLRQVRRDDRREREQPVDEHVDRVVLEQLRARARDHHRVDDQRHTVHGEEVGDRLDQLAREEHPRLRRVDADVVEDGLELRPRTNSGGSSCTAVTPSVFCAVSATIALVP